MKTKKLSESNSTVEVGNTLITKGAKGEYSHTVERLTYNTYNDENGSHTDQIISARNVANDHLGIFSLPHLINIGATVVSHG